MRTTAPFMLVLFAAVGCTPDYYLADKGDGVDEIGDGDAPDIEVTPTEVDFGALPVTADGSTQIINVSNVGLGDLHILSVEMEDPTSPFEIGAIGTVLLPSTLSTTFTVSFYPETASSNTGTVLIQT